MMHVLTAKRIIVILLNEKECGSGAAVARLLAKEKVASSNLVFRSQGSLRRFPFCYPPEWRNGRRTALKMPRGKPHAGSSPASGTGVQSYLVSGIIRGPFRSCSP